MPADLVSDLLSVLFRDLCPDAHLKAALGLLMSNALGLPHEIAQLAEAIGTDVVKSETRFDNCLPTSRKRTQPVFALHSERPAFLRAE